MVFTNLTPFTPAMTPITNISPLTYRDASTFLEYLETIKEYINDTLVPDTNAMIDNAITEYQGAKDSWDTNYREIMDNLAAQIAVLNEAAVTGLINAGTAHAAIIALIDAQIADTVAAVAAETTARENAVAAETAARVQAVTDEATARDAQITGIPDGYLFASFVANGTSGEKLSLFYSPDGKTVFGGSNNPAYTPVDGQGLRDPSLIYYGDRFYVAYTSNNGNDKDLHIATSVTGAPGTWTLHTTIDASGIGGLEQAWAPEFVTGDDGIYLFFTKVAAAKGSMYWVKANNTNLTGWTAPQPVNFTVFPDNWIDGVPVKKGNQWYLFFSDGSGIGRAVADTLTGTYTTDRTGNWNGWGTGIEGPILVKDGATWRAYFDRYVAGTGYWWSESTDLDNWTTPQQLATAPGLLATGQTLRHGGMLKLTPPARNKALAGQGMPRRRRHLELYITPGTTVGRDTETTFTGWQVDANETTDASIASYDPATGIITLNITGGIYRFALNTAAPNFTAGVDNVTRAYCNYGMPDGPLTEFRRESGGVEDKFGLVVPNHHAKDGERIRFRVYCNWAGSATTGQFPARLKITLD
jgi:hypothetical protein